MAFFHFPHNSPHFHRGLNNLVSFSLMPQLSPEGDELKDSSISGKQHTAMPGDGLQVLFLLPPTPCGHS